VLKKKCTLSWELGIPITPLRLTLKPTNPSGDPHFHEKLTSGIMAIKSLLLSLTLTCCLGYAFTFGITSSNSFLHKLPSWSFIPLSIGFGILYLVAFWWGIRGFMANKFAYLYLRHCQLSDLSQLRSEGLDRLDVSDNQCTDLATLKNCPNLRWLTINNNPLISKEHAHLFPNMVAFQANIVLLKNNKKS